MNGSVCTVRFGFILLLYRYHRFMPCCVAVFSFSYISFCIVATLQSMQHGNYILPKFRVHFGIHMHMHVCIVHRRMASSLYIDIGIGMCVACTVYEMYLQLTAIYRMRKVVVYLRYFYLGGYIFLAVIVVVSVMEYIWIPLLGRFVMQDFIHTTTRSCEEHYFWEFFFAFFSCIAPFGWHLYVYVCRPRWYR